MLHRFKLGPKLVGGFLLLAILCGLVGYQGIATMDEVDEHLREIHQHHITPLKQLTAINDLYTVDIVDACQKLRNGNISWIEAQKKIAAAKEAVDREIQVYLAMSHDEQERLLTGELDALHKSAAAQLSRLMEILEAKSREQLDDFVVNRLYPMTDPIGQKCSELIAKEMKDIKSAIDESSAHFYTARRVSVVIVVVSVLASLVLGFILTRNITVPAGKMAVAARNIAIGDIDQDVDFRSADEIGSLAASFRQMIEYVKGVATAAEALSLGDVSTQISPRSEKDLLSRNFIRLMEYIRTLASAADAVRRGDLTVTVKPQSPADVLGNSFAAMTENLRRMTLEIREAVGVLASSISEISAITTQLASSSTETATAVTETTTTAEEVKQTSRVASDKARYVSESAQKVMQISHAGKQATEETVEGMHRIREQMTSIAESIVRLSEQSQAIGEIIATVNDLADQSNLLAVNASIEAAKAGEEGKGFVVVAQEIRSLAEQSKQATAQVRTILNDIQKATSAAVMATERGSKAVEEGVRRSAQSGESIVVLGSSIAEAAQAAVQIAASTQQQLVGMDQVALAMENIQRASTQNVEGARQLEAAAHGLNDLGQRLKALVDQYRV